MNYYETKQRTDGKWDYTCNNRPTGYCCEFKPFDEGFVKNYHVSEAEVEKHNRFAHKYHSHGHDTEQEACECYKEYQLDHKLRFSKSESEQRKCKVCGEWTQNFAEVDCRLITLCDKHNNREEVSKLYEASNWSMASW